MPLQVRKTPISFAPNVSRAVGKDVFVKRDDQSHVLYGGTKVRKLAPMLEDAIRRRATDLVTVGSIGSNHVLSTSVHGRELGFNVHAVLVPQPDSEYARTTARMIASQ